MGFAVQEGRAREKAEKKEEVEGWENPSRARKKSGRGNERKIAHAPMLAILEPKHKHRERKEKAIWLVRLQKSWSGGRGSERYWISRPSCNSFGKSQKKRRD